MVCSLSKLLVPTALAWAGVGFVVNPVQALTLFSGNYAPANWTQSIGGDGTINTSGAPLVVILRGADNGGGNQNTDFTIAAPLAGTVSFNWNYANASTFQAVWDPFGYLLNGAFNKLTDAGLVGNQSGSISFSVNAGDVFQAKQF
jgi:hypothetical protein